MAENGSTSELSLEARCLRLLQASGLQCMARVHHKGAVWDLAFLTTRGARVLVRCDPDELDETKDGLRTIALQGTFDQLLLITEATLAESDPCFSTYTISELEEPSTLNSIAGCTS